MLDATRPSRHALLTLLLALHLPACALYDGLSSEDGSTSEDMSAAADMATDMATDMTVDMSPDMTPDMNVEDMPADMPSPADMPKDMTQDMGAEDMPTDMDMSEGCGDWSNTSTGQTPSLTGRQLDVAYSKDGLVQVIGAEGYGQNVETERVVRVREADGTIVVLDSKIIGPEEPDHKFGATVAISPDGEFIAVSSQHEQYSSETEGVIYLYDRDALGSWSDAGTIPAPQNSGVGGRFGQGLDITLGKDGSYNVIIGAPRVDFTVEGVEYPDLGLVFVYERLKESQTLTRKATITLPPPSENNAFAQAHRGAFFGWSVAGAGSYSNQDLTLIIGAPYSDTVLDVGCPVRRMGAAYIMTFAQGPNQLEFLDRLAPSTSGSTLDEGLIANLQEPYIEFGFDVDVVGTFRRNQSNQYKGSAVFAASAPGGFDGAGAVYVQVIGAGTQDESASFGPRTSLLTIPPNPEGVNATPRFGASLALAGSLTCSVSNCLDFDDANVALVSGAPTKIPRAGSSRGVVYAYGFATDGPTSNNLGPTWEEATFTAPSSAPYPLTAPGGALGFGQGVALALDPDAMRPVDPFVGAATHNGPFSPQDNPSSFEVQPILQP